MARASHIAAMIPQIASGVATLPGTLNPYPYALNNPVNNTDPSGEFLDTILDFGFIAYDLYRIGADNIFGKGDNLNENLLSLAADVGGLAIPFCSGGGMAVRGTRLVAREAEHALPAVTRLTRAGKYPSWTTVRGRMNRLQVEQNPGLWSQEDVARMREGRNPAGYEWHHNNGRGGPDPHSPGNLRLLPRDEHRAIHFGRPRP